MSDASGDALAPPNTFIFNGARARQGYRLNRLAMSLIEPENRAALKADEVGYMREMGLGEDEIALVGRRDWQGLLAQGGNVYLLYKLAGALGVSLPEMGAQMRGVSIEEMLAGRPGHKPAQRKGG